MNSTFRSPADTADDSPVRPGLIARLWQQRLVVAPTFGLALFVVIGLLYLLPVTYVATGALLVADRDPVSPAVTPATTTATVTAPSDPADVESTVLLVRSPRLARTLLTQPGIGAAIEADCASTARQLLNRLRPIDCAGVSGDPDVELQWIQDRFGVTAIGASHVVSVSYRSPSPEVAQAMVNGLLQIFLDDERTKLRHTRDEAAEWLRSRLAQLNAKLQNDATDIEAFRTQHNLVPGSTGTLAAGRLTLAVERLNEARASLAEAQGQTQDPRGPGARPATDTRAMADLRRQLSQTSAQVASAASRYGSQNPTLLALRQQEAALAARLATETSRGSEARPVDTTRPTEATRRNLEAARARVDQAEHDLGAQTETAIQATGAETQLAGLIHDLDVERNTSVDLSRRLSQLDTERRLLEPNVQLVNLAERPTHQASPQKTPFLIGGLAFASVLATTAGLLTYRPVQSGPIALGRTYTRIPILAQIPELRLRRTGKREVARLNGFPFAAAISLLGSHPPLLEAIRILHARLALAGFGTKHRTLLIASEVAGEGKSFVTFALARMARASGRRVLVIETSLRQPFLEEALHGPPNAGLAGFFRGGPIETIHLGALPGVEFILAGDAMGDSTELFAGARFGELLDWAQQFDLVLIDSAPVSELMDAALLAQRVDGVVFCLRAGRSPALNALNSLPEMQRANGNVVGLTLTFTPDEHTAAPGNGQARKLQPQRQLQAGSV